MESASHPISRSRRLYVGDLHGCLAELNALLERFGFRPGLDRLFSVGDIIGKGPDVPGTLKRLRELDAGIVAGNHDLTLLEAADAKAADAEAAGIKPKHRDYLDSLGMEKEAWIAWIRSWPFYIDSADVLLVHAGLDPRGGDIGKMSHRILTQIRTWDGKGLNLNRDGDPAWYELVKTEQTVVFGHWAKKGLIDLPGFKGLDTGCVYGGKLSGWCPEENRIIQVDALRAYAPIHYH